MKYFERYFQLSFSSYLAPEIFYIFSLKNISRGKSISKQAKKKNGRSGKIQNLKMSKFS